MMLRRRFSCTVRSGNQFEFRPFVQIEMRDSFSPKRHNTSSTVPKRLSYPRSVPVDDEYHDGDVVNGGSVAAAFGLPGNPAEVEAMILERAAARRRPIGTPRRSARATGETPRQQHVDAEYDSRPPLASARRNRSSGLPSAPHAYPLPSDRHQTGEYVAASFLDARRPTVGVEAAVSAGLDTASTVQYISQLEHQITALEAEHSRLCRVLLRSVSKSAVADCQLLEAEARRELTAEALDSQQRIFTAVASRFAAQAVAEGLERQVAAASVDDPRRAFAEAVSTLGSLHAGVKETLAAAHEATASLRVRDNSWRAEAAALADAVGATRADLLRSVASHRAEVSEAHDAQTADLRRLMTATNDAVQSAETGIVLKFQSIMQSHGTVMETATTNVASAVGQLHNEVRSGQRDVQRLLSEELHALSRKLEDLTRAQSTASGNHGSSPLTQDALDDLIARVEDAVTRGVANAAASASTTQQVAEHNREARAALATSLGREASLARAFVHQRATAASRHLDALHAAFADASFNKSIWVSEQARVAAVIANAWSSSSPKGAAVPASATAASRAAAATQTFIGLRSFGTVTVDVHSRPEACQTDDMFDPVKRSPTQVVATVATQTTESPLLYPEVSEVTTSLSPFATPQASDVYGAAAAAELTRSMEVAESPMTRAVHAGTAPPTPQPLPLPKTALVEPTVGTALNGDESFEANRHRPLTTSNSDRPGVPSSLPPRTNAGATAANTIAQSTARPAAKPAGTRTTVAHDGDVDDDDDDDDIDLSLDESSDDTPAKRVPAPSAFAKAVMDRPPRKQTPPSASTSPLPAISAANDSITDTPPALRPKFTMPAPASTRAGPSGSSGNFDTTNADALFANLSINVTAPPHNFDDDPPTPLEQSANLSPRARPLVASSLSPRVDGPGETFPSPFRDSARVKRNNSFDSPNGMKSPRSRSVRFMDGDDSPAIRTPRRGASPSFVLDHAHPPQALVGSNSGSAAGGGGGGGFGGGGGSSTGSALGLMSIGSTAGRPPLLVVPTDRAASPNTNTSTPSLSTTPTPAVTISSTHLGVKKKGLPSLGGLGGGSTLAPNKSSSAFGASPSTNASPLGPRGASATAKTMAAAGGVGGGPSTLGVPGGGTRQLPPMALGGSAVGTAAAGSVVTSASASTYNDWDDD
jgi:hypothetical protein